MATGKRNNGKLQKKFAVMRWLDDYNRLSVHDTMHVTEPKDKEEMTKWLKLNILRLMEDVSDKFLEGSRSALTHPSEATANPDVEKLIEAGDESMIKDASTPQSKSSKRSNRNVNTGRNDTNKEERKKEKQMLKMQKELEMSVMNKLAAGILMKNVKEKSKNDDSANDIRDNGISVYDDSDNGICVYDDSDNGISVNGCSDNGISVNGCSDNDISVNGISVNDDSDDGINENEKMILTHTSASASTHKTGTYVNHQSKISRYHIPSSRESPKASKGTSPRKVIASRRTSPKNTLSGQKKLTGKNMIVMMMIMNGLPLPQVFKT